MEAELAVSPQFYKPYIPTFPIKPFTPKLIGLAGPARSGKDTVAKLLKTAVGNVESLAFADPIRNMLGAGFGFDERHFNGPLKEVQIDWIGKSYRQMAQTLGTEWGREQVNQNLWVLHAWERAKKFHAEGKHVVVTDVRFNNEADFLREHGATVWHVVRPNVQAVQAHVSEAGILWSTEDFTIVNNSTVEDLLDNVLEAFELSKEG